jgi:hypothetical protein
MMSDLVALAVSLAPELAVALAAPDSGGVADDVVQAVQAATGTADEAAARQVLSRDPKAAIELRARLAEIAAAAGRVLRQREQADMLSQVPGVAAPPASVGGSGGSGRAGDQWGAPVVSLAVLATFGLVMLAVMVRALPAGSETIVNMLLGTLAAMATSVVSYWVGSSAGSASKTDLLFRTRTPPPPPGS